MWHKLEWLNWICQFPCEELFSFNPKRFCYSYTWFCSLCEGKTSFCTRPLGTSFPLTVLHICLVTFISFILYNKVHLIRFAIHFHLNDFIDHSPSRSHLPYLVILILHCISTSLSLWFFNQSRLWKLGVSLDKVLIWNTYCFIWSWTLMVLLLLVTLQESRHTGFLENSVVSNLCFWLALFHSVSYFFFRYWSPFLSLCTVFDAISSNIDEAFSINSSTNVFLFGDCLVELTNLVYLVIIFLSQMTLLRWLTFLLKYLTVTLTVLVPYIGKFWSCCYLSFNWLPVFIA